MNLTEWRNRQMVVKVFDRCNECEQLREDVKPHESIWPALKLICCSQCFSRLVAEHEGLTYC